MKQVTRNSALFWAGLQMALLGCAPPSGGGGGTTLARAEAMARDRDDPNMITRDEIRASRARNGWEALRRNARHLMLVERRGAVDGQVGVQHRGPDSLINSDDFVLIIDGLLTTEMRRLRQIPAGTIESIQIMGAREAVLRFGSDAGGGAIVVITAGSGG